MMRTMGRETKDPVESDDDENSIIKKIIDD